MVKPLSIYIHIPFCTKKCGYCQFMVIPYHERFVQPYLEAIKMELQRALPHFQSSSIISIYLGGGTPSLLPTRALEEILSQIRPYLKDTEITLEANPESVTSEKAADWKKIGINRISLGVQSFQDHELMHLTRTHGSKQIFFAIEHIIKSGLENLSIDLLYDLFDQTPELLSKNLQHANTLPLTHLSLYNLVIEPHTSFYKQKKMALQPKEDSSLELHLLAIEMLREIGFERYEISAFSKKGYASKHNLGYWTGREFLGFGPSAWSYFHKKRSRKTQLFQRWIKEVKNGEEAYDFEETLEEPFASYEKLAIGLRVLQGVELTPLQAMHPELAILEQEGFLERQNHLVKLTSKGTLFYDTVAEKLV